MNSIVALVGMPNVGKSTLFNRMIKGGYEKDKPGAITDKTPGVTRDRNYGNVRWGEKTFTVIDTGGFYFDEPRLTDITVQVREQAIAAMQEADLILHVMDGKMGINPFDIELAQVVRESGKRFLLIVNKTDTPGKQDKTVDFYSLGGEIFFVSALTGYGFEELMEKIITLLPAKGEGGKIAVASDIPKIAVVGRPNTGKSTLINSLLSSKRLIVSPMPGTTRDSIDTICSYYGRKYLFIDTAGIRKGAGRSFFYLKDPSHGQYSNKTILERMSVMNALKSIQRADVVLIVIDASEGIVEQDQRIAGMVMESGKGAIFLLNKWDIIETPDIAYKNILNTITRKMWFMNYAPVLTISGLEKKRITKIFPLIDDINLQRKRLLSSDELNALLSSLSHSLQSIMPGARNFRLTGIKQSGIEPPAFDIYTNQPSMIKGNILIFAEKVFRGMFSFKGTPVRIFFKSR